VLYNVKMAKFARCLYGQHGRRNIFWTFLTHCTTKLVSYLVFNVPFQHKYGYITETKGQGWRAIPTQHRKAIVAFKAELYSNVLLYDFVIPQCPCDCYDHLTMSAWLPHGARAICTIVRSQCGAMRLVHEHRMT